MTKPSSAIASLLALAGIAAAAAAGGADTKLMMNKIGGYTAPGDEGGEKIEFEITATKLSSKVWGLSYPILYFTPTLSLALSGVSTELAAPTYERTYSSKYHVYCFAY